MSEVHFLVRSTTYSDQQQYSIFWTLESLTVHSVYYSAKWWQLVFIELLLFPRIFTAVTYEVRSKAAAIDAWPRSGWRCFLLQWLATATNLLWRINPSSFHLWVSTKEESCRRGSNRSDRANCARYLQWLVASAERGYFTRGLMLQINVVNFCRKYELRCNIEYFPSKCRVMRTVFLEEFNGAKRHFLDGSPRNDPTGRSNKVLRERSTESGHPVDENSEPRYKEIVF